MASVEELLRDYIAEHRAGGEADPREFLDRLEGTDREELAALIDAYLVRAPGAEWDAAAFRGSPAERVAEALERSLSGEAGLWPAILPRLRDRARVKRRELVGRLADALGVAERQEKVAAYYNRMEQGTLPAAGVSHRVLDALAAIVGTSSEALRRAGESIGPRAGPAGEETVFARTAQQRLDLEPPEAPSAPADASPPEMAAEWDEVDRLFMGGE